MAGSSVNQVAGKRSLKPPATAGGSDIPALMHSYARVWLALLSTIIAISALAFVKPASAQQPQQRLVETVDIIGNRRLRKDDILYYVQTRPGDVYNPAQVERDLQAILAL